MTTTPVPYPLADLALARRLERAEAHANAKSVEARARVWPDSGACWIEVAGAYAMFDGMDSPLTQTFGLGLFDQVEEADLAALEAFFSDRGAPVFHEVSPLADPVLVGLLSGRGYRPFEFTSVMFRPIDLAAEAPLGRVSEVPPRVRVHVTHESERADWARTAAEGWSEFPEVEAFMRDIGPLVTATEDSTCFLADLEGEAIAAAVLRVHDGVALLAGASTVPGRRRQGAQLALLDARLRFAAERGCTLAMMCAAPGSTSQRNAERHGFRIAYTRLKWRQ